MISLAIDKYLSAQLKEKYGDEQVFVVPHHLLSEIEPNQFTSRNHMPNIWSMYDTNGRYIYRYEAEADASLQQIIPYIVVYNPISRQYFVSSRLQKSGDERLHGFKSIGFGGHINPEDGTKDVIFKALFRELHEELYIEPTKEAQFIGYVRKFTTNDTSSKDFVHSVHVGMVFLIQAHEASIKEIDKLEGEWMTAQELEKNYFKFEDWSKLVINHIVTK